MQGWYTKDRPNKNLDVTIVEATDIKEDGSIVPGASVGATPELVQMADKVGQPDSLETCMLGRGSLTQTLHPDHHRGQHVSAQLRGSP
jgi:acetyl-CoA hydrolase